ncbi:MAG TPA: replication-associated recombination protein A [Saprospiraceae bacterium]|nr:replication-associated recombination protein A [Saprospiraceae bacterium]
MQAPLAERMRPKTLDQFYGQDHITGPGAILRKALESGHIPSLILWGPPGVGKTTLAQILATSLQRPFVSLSAINAGVKDIREAIEKAKKQDIFSKPNPILFIDEIHRFSKSQQDSLLGAVEKGIITLIGATTENPSFEVIPALLSRCQVYTLYPLNKEVLTGLIDYAIQNDAYLKPKEIKMKSYDALLRFSGGDARKLLNGLELVVKLFKQDEVIIITDEWVMQSIQQNMALYDKAGEQHYDIISAFIKSVRGSDPNAATYYLARMIDGGEDPLFICRRMIILASEDIGLANPNALLLANACFESVHKIGMPEGRIPMSQTAIYLACSPKSNSAYTAINSAMAITKASGDLSVPLALRNAPTSLMRSMGYGQEYKYAHDYENHFVNIEMLPEDIKGSVFYTPANNPSENNMRERLRILWKKKYGY